MVEKFALKQRSFRREASTVLILGIAFALVYGTMFLTLVIPSIDEFPGFFMIGLFTFLIGCMFYLIWMPSLRLYQIRKAKGTILTLDDQGIRLMDLERHDVLFADIDQVVVQKPHALAEDYEIFIHLNKANPHRGHFRPTAYFLVIKHFAHKVHIRVRYMHGDIVAIAAEINARANLSQPKGSAPIDDDPMFTD